MAEANLKIKISSEDAALKSLLQTIANLQSMLGGSMPAAAKAAAQKTSDEIVAIKKTAEEKLKKIEKDEAASHATTQEAIKAATERRIKGEEAAEKLKFEQLKESYKQQIKETDILNAALKASKDKEVKAEIKAELDKANELKKIYATELKERPETKKGKASDTGMLGTGRELRGASLKGGLEIGAAIEGFKLLTEKTEEVAHAQKALQAGTGLTGEALNKAGKDAEELGAKFLISANTAKGVMGKVAAYTGATGDELKKQTEAAMAYSVATGKNMDMVGKLMATEQGRAKIMRDAEVNIAKAQQAANEPAQKALFIQQQLTEKVGDLALVVLNALGPALGAVIPIIDALGGLIESVVKPAMEALSPVMELIATAFKDMAPIITGLIKGALSLLTPIITSISDTMQTLIPVIVEVVKTIGQALSPVFDALKPVIATVASVLAELAKGSLQTLLIPVLEILVPIIRDVLAPVLLALAPLLQMIANLAQAVLTPAIQALSAILHFIVTSAIQPLVSWLTGKLTAAIQSTVGLITKAVGAITSVVSSITSFLGVGDKAATATKDAGAKVLNADKENADALQKQKIIQDGQEKIRLRNELTARLKAGKLSLKEEQELRETAEEEGNLAMIAKLDALDKKRESQAASSAHKAASQAKKSAKEKFDAEKQALDEWLADEKAKLETANAEGALSDAKLKEQELILDKQHADKLVTLSDSYHQKSISAKAASAKAAAALRKATQDQAVADEKAHTEDLLAALDIRAAQENLTDKETADERYRITHDGLQKEIEIRRKNGEDVSKLEAQLAAMQAKNNQDRLKSEIALAKEIGKARTDERKQRLAEMKESGADANDIQKEENAIAVQEEEERYKEILEARKDDLANTKLGNALKLSLEQDHQGKMRAIQAKALKEEQTQQLEKFKFVTNAYSALTSQIDTKYFKPIGEKWFGQNELAKGVFTDLTQEGIKFITKLISQQAIALAQQMGFIAASTAATSAAGATATAAWTPAAVSASIATVGAADAAGSSAFLSAQAAAQAATLATAIPHAEGGVSMGAEYFPMAGGNIGLRGEAGPELHVPLNRYEGARDLLHGGLAEKIVAGLTPHFDRVTTAIHNTPDTAVLPPYSSRIWQSQATRVVNQRKLGS